MEAIQTYQSVEQQSSTRYKQRIERQYKIGEPVKHHIQNVGGFNGLHQLNPMPLRKKSRLLSMTTAEDKYSAKQCVLALILFTSRSSLTHAYYHLY